MGKDIGVVSSQSAPLTSCTTPGPSSNQRSLTTKASESVAQSVTASSHPTSKPLSIRRKSVGDKLKTLNSDGLAVSERGSYSRSGGHHHRFDSKNEALVNKMSFSVECYMISIVVLLIILAGLIVALCFSYVHEPLEDKFYIDIPYGLETSRKAVVFASENLDCSLLTKRKIMAVKNIDDIVYVPMKCLHVTESHSAAPDSAVSMMYHIEQESQNLARALDGFDRNTDRHKCALGNPKNIYCYIAFQINTVNGHVHVKGEFTESDFQSQLFRNGIYQYLTLFQDQFLHTFPFGDQGPTEYSKSLFTYQYHHNLGIYKPYNRTSLGMKELERIDTFAYTFFTSALFSKLARNQTIPPHIKRVIGNENITKGRPLRVTRNLTRYLVDSFSNQKKAQKPSEIGTIRIPLMRNLTDLVERRRDYVIIPKGPTLSIISAFVIKVVHDTMFMHSKGMGEEEKEERMYSLIALTHKVAIGLLPKSLEWTGYGTRMNLIDYAPQVIQIILETEELKDLEEKFRTLTRNRKVRRRKFDRVTSFAYWYIHKNKFAQMVSMGLPKLFSSTYYGNERGEMGRFSNEKDRSQPFISSAGILIQKGRINVRDEDDITHIVTSSGSLRTVDAVVGPTLRMLILHDNPGKAVYAPSVFYDASSGKYFCERNEAVDHPHFKDHVKRIRKALRSNGIRCFMVDKKNFASVDRVAIAMKRDVQLTSDILAAIDPRQLDKNNYPVGF